MDGENTYGPLGARSFRSRPHWWAVLAVSLSLLALVAAVTSNHPGTVDHGRKTAPTIHQNSSGTTPLLPADPTTTVPEPSPSAVTPATSSPPDSPPETSGGVRVIARQSTATTTTTTTTTAPPAPQSDQETAPAQPTVSTETQTGYLQQPDDSAASYTFTGAGSMQISATWASSSTLSLSVTCPDGAKTEEGSSTVTVVIPNAGGACETTLKETIVEYEAVSYTLTIGPADGS